MLKNCLFFKVLFLLISLLVLSSDITCASLDHFETTPDLQEDDNMGSNTLLYESSFNLSREIKDFAMSQLGLVGSHKGFIFSDYEITNWPIMVPKRFINWDEQALVELRDALPSMIFTVKLAQDKSSSPSEHSLIERANNRRFLLDMFLESFKKQTKNENITRIMWTRYHLKGWPRGVKFRSDHWNCSEMLALYRNLDKIKFEPILLGQKQTITYADEEAEISENDDNNLMSDSDSEGLSATNQPQIFSNDSVKNRRLVLDMLLDSYKRQTKKENRKIINWSDYHLKGWPRGVKFRADRWSNSEILAVYRNLEKIRFEPILPGEKWTITYVEVESEVAKSNKRKFVDDSDTDDEVDQDGTYARITAKEHMVANNSSVSSGSCSLYAYSSAGSSSSSSSLYLEPSDKDLLDSDMTRYSLNGNSTNFQYQHQEHHNGQSGLSSSYRGHDRGRIRSTRFNLQKGNSSSIDPFQQSCFDLCNEIKDFSMNQLGLQLLRSQFDLNDYTILNWPIFVPISYKMWDEQALKSYKQQTNDDTVKSIPWSKCHIKGWPCNVKFLSSRWTNSGILTLYRNLENIKFESLLPTITYSDGRVEYIKKNKRKYVFFSDDVDESEEDETDEDNSVNEDVIIDSN